MRGSAYTTPKARVAVLQHDTLLYFDVEAYCQRIIALHAKNMKRSTPKQFPIKHEPLPNSNLYYMC